MSAPRHALALPVIYSSPADDGANTGIVTLPADAQPVTLSLYLDPGEFAFEYVVGFEASVGLVLQSFAAEDRGAVVNFDAVGGTLALVASLGPGRADPVRIGALVVVGTLAGAELRLVDLPNAAMPSLTNESFGLTLIPVPQTIARVPEPDPRLLVWAASLALALARRRISARAG